MAWETQEEDPILQGQEQSQGKESSPEGLFRFSDSVKCSTVLGGSRGPSVSPLLFPGGLTQMSPASLSSTIVSESGVLRKVPFKAGGLYNTLSPTLTVTAGSFDFKSTKASFPCWWRVWASDIRLTAAGPQPETARVSRRCVRTGFWDIGRVLVKAPRTRPVKRVPWSLERVERAPQVGNTF